MGFSDLQMRAIKRIGVFFEIAQEACRRPFLLQAFAIAIKRYRRLFADGFDFGDRLNPNMERLGQRDDGLGR